MMADLPPPIIEEVLNKVVKVTENQQLKPFLARVVVKHPKHLRVKELLETLECFRTLVRYATRLQTERKIDRIFDFCCGHGLLGILLGYKFPELNIVCVDIDPSPAFGHYKSVIKLIEGPSSTTCERVHLVKGDARATPVTKRDLTVCIHGCNEISKHLLQQCNDAKAPFAVMPCCIRDGLYGVGITHMKGDDAKYQISCGVIAQRYSAIRITAITRHVTPRNLMIIGPKPDEAPVKPG